MAVKTMRLVSGSKYRLPISKKIVTLNDPFVVMSPEYEQIKDSGRFLEVVDGVSLTLVDNDKQTSPHLPDDWTGQKILLRNLGGVGDSLICSAMCNTLKRKKCIINLAVPSDIVSLFKRIKNVDTVYAIADAEKHINQYDVVLDMGYTFADTVQRIRDNEYYELLRQRLGFPTAIDLPKLELDQSRLALARQKMPSRPCVALHAGASNPVRRWDNEKWRKLAYFLQKDGISVVWLGKGGFDFGFEDTNIAFAENICNDLLEQTEVLANCHYFIGSDSGFAHLAGILAVPGSVIFSCSKPEHVIARYPKLKAIAVYADLNIVPSRTLKNNDNDAELCMQKISVEQVYNSIDKGLFKALPSGKKQSVNANRIVRRSQLNQQTKLLVIFPHMIVGGGERVLTTLCSNLQKYFHIDAIGLHLSHRNDGEELKETIQKSLNGELHIFNKEQELVDLTNFLNATDYDLVIYYGWSNEITSVLNKLKSSPAVLRIIHTQSEQELLAVETIRKYLDGLICVTKEAAHRLDGTWIPNAVDTKRFPEIPPIKLFDNTNLILGYIGRVDSFKGLARVLELQTTHGISFNLVIVGVGEDSESRFIQRMIKDYHLEKQVKLVTRTEDVNQYYRSIDAYILLSDNEGMPLGVLEAAYCGKPSICTPVGVLPTLFIDKQNIVFCNKKSDNFKKCLELIRNKGKQIGVSAQTLVKQNYTDDKQAVAYRKIIRKTLGKTWPENIQKGKIRIKRMPGAGDVIMASSLISKARETFPNAILEFQTEKTQLDLVRCHPDISKVDDSFSYKADLEIEALYYDCWKRNQHILTAMGGNNYEEMVVIPDIVQKLNSGKQLKKPNIGIFAFQAPSGYYKVKEWPINNWIELCKRLQEQGITAYQLGAKFEPVIDGVIDLRRDGLLNVMAQMTNMDLIVSIDGFAQHASHVLNKKHITLWGGSAEPWIASYPEQIIVRTKSKGRCWSAVCASTYRQPGCCNDMSCMKDISVDSVFNAIFNVLKI